MWLTWRNRLCAAAVCSLIFGFVPNFGHAAGFDCRKAKGEIEIAICNSPELSKADSELNELYRALLPKLSQVGSEILIRTQKDWLKLNCEICTKIQSESLSDCLLFRFKDRIKYLRSASEKYSPFIILMDNSQSETASNVDDNHEIPLEGDWPFFDGPEYKLNDVLNGIVNNTCGPSGIAQGNGAFYRCHLTFLNKKFVSFLYAAGSPPGFEEVVGVMTQTSIANYISESYSFNLNDGSALAAGDLFVLGSKWEDAMIKACAALQPPPRAPIQPDQRPGAWLLTDEGLAVDCGEQEGQLVPAPSATISWPDLTPYLKPGVLAR